MANNNGPVWQQVDVTATGENALTRHEFVPQTAGTFTSDADGNRLTDGRWSNTRDAENRLVQMVARKAVGPQQLIQFADDWQGRQIRKQVWDNTAGSGNPVVDERCVYDGWNLLAILSSQSTVLQPHQRLRQARPRADH